MSNELLPVTTLKILINDWLKLRDVIATLVKPRKTNAPKSGNLLSDTEFFDAFHGPYHVALQRLSQAYASLSKQRTYLIITQNENIKSHVRNADQFAEGSPTELNAATLDKEQRKLDDLTERHFKDWLSHLSEWQQQLIMQLTVHEINLSDHEIEDLSQLEPLSELLDRFTDLSLTPPKGTTEKYLTADFLKAKTILCIHSALARQHQTHTPEEIQKKLKLLKDDFKHIEKSEKTLYHTLEQKLKAG